MVRRRAYLPGPIFGPLSGLVSGCYPLDRYYASKPEAQKLKKIKKPQA